MLDDANILHIVSQELSQSAGGNENEFIDSNRKDALSYYLGSKLGNELDGRSQVVSTDIADAIEWILTPKWPAMRIRRRWSRRLSMTS